MKVSFAAFVWRWLNKSLDRDGLYGPQCMDLVEQYVADVLGLPGLGGNAVDLWKLALGRGWVRVPNTPTNHPPPGCIVVWGESPTAGTGRYGHAAVSLLADRSYLGSLDQNWPVGSAIHLQEHNYAGVLGWLQPAELPTL